jgi:hypothetical protein
MRYYNGVAENQDQVSYNFENNMERNSAAAVNQLHIKYKKNSNSKVFIYCE